MAVEDDSLYDRDRVSDVVVSGAVPVTVAKEKWSLANAKTNTWKLDVRGQRLPKGFGLRVGTRRAIRAKYPNGDPETAASYCIIPLGSNAQPGANVVFTRNAR